jgi:hypothetical protein
MRVGGWVGYLLCKYLGYCFVEDSSGESANSGGSTQGEVLWPE